MGVLIIRSLLLGVHIRALILGSFHVPEEVEKQVRQTPRYRAGAILSHSSIRSSYL